MDTSGPIAVEFLNRLGIETPAAQVVADSDIAAAVDAAFAAGHSVILTSGGTGLSPDDGTVEAVSKHLDRHLPGIIHAFYGASDIPTAILSRAVAGVTGTTFAMTLPGSKGGVKDGCAVLEPVLSHVLDQLAGNRDHGNHSHGQHSHVGPIHHGCCHSDAPDPDYVAAETGIVLHAAMTTEPIDTPTALAQVGTPAMGAAVTFDGIVRNHDGGRGGVKQLTYTAHPTAQAEIERVAADVSAAHPKTRLWCEHRTGDLEVGESAFVVVAAAAHRGDAFAAAEELSDRVKAEVPIWKEQQFVDGHATWVGLE